MLVLGQPRALCAAGAPSGEFLKQQLLSPQHQDMSCGSASVETFLSSLEAVNWDAASESTMEKSLETVSLEREKREKTVL